MASLQTHSDHGNAGADFAPGRTDVRLDQWANLLFLEPSLAELARVASRGGMPADWTKIITSLARLAGPSARREQLRGVRAYESARDYLRGLFDHPAPRRLRGER